VLRKILRGRKWWKAGESYIMRNFVTCTLHHIFFLMIKSRRMRWAGHVPHMGKMTNSYKILIGKTRREEPLGRPKHRWENNIRMDIREIGWKAVNWTHLAQDRDHWQALVDTVMNLWVQ